MKEDQNSKKKISKFTLFLLLAAQSFIWTPAFYSYDFPQLFESFLIKSLGIDTVQIEFLYTLAAIPSTLVLPFLGPISNKISIGVTSILYSSFLFIGTFFSFWGTVKQSYLWLVVGRAIFGIGEGNLFALQVTIAEKWFVGKFLSVSIAINVVIGFIFTSAAAYFEPLLLLKYRDLGTVMFVYSLVTFVSFLASFWYWTLEVKNEKLILEEKSEGKEEEEEVKVLISDVFKVSKLALIMILYEFFFCFLYFSTMGIMTDLLMIRFNFSFEDAKNKEAVIPLISLVSTLLSSLYAQKFGKRSIMVGLCGVTGMTSIVFMIFLPDHPGNTIFIPLALLAIFYGVFTSVYWASVPFTCSKELVSLVVGIAATFGNSGMGLGPLYIGFICKKRNYESYSRSLFHLLVVGLLCAICGLLAIYWDFKGEKVLHYPENDDIVKEIREKWSKEFRKNRIEESRNSKSLLTGKTRSDARFTDNVDYDDD